MKPGRLDREIVIESATLSANSIGEMVETWATFASVWAQVAPLSAGERFRSEARHSARVSVFTIRYLDGLLPTMRIKYENLFWRILGIAEVGRRHWLEITAEVVY